MEIPQAEAVSDLVNHLYDEGCRNIGVITGNMNWSAAEERLRGWRETLATHDLPAEPRQIAEGDWTPESGQEGTERLLTQFPEMDAILACNDQMALGALSALHARGIQVPQQIAVVGFDDVPEARFLTPSLTTIRQDFALYGTIQVNIALEMIQQQISTGEFHFPPPKYMRPQLVIRESSRHSIHINPS
jgi:LacI family transcriptional regulator